MYAVQNHLLLVFLDFYLFHLVFSCVFALCTNKNHYTYDVMIEELKLAAQQMNRNFSPPLIMSDYEGGFIKVVKQVVSSILHTF